MNAIFRQRLAVNKRKIDSKIVQVTPSDTKLVPIPDIIFGYLFLVYHNVTRKWYRYLIKYVATYFLMTMTLMTVRMKIIS